MDCEYSKRCWRYSYSRYLLDKGYSVPPDRIVLCFEQYADLAILKNGMFAEHMPLNRDGEIVNICPALCNRQAVECPEYQKETRRLAALAKARENSRKYFEARKRVWIPQETRIAVAHRDHYTCVYCHRHQNQIWNGKKIHCCVDHYVPLAVGGDETSESNLVFACTDCNQAKGANVWKFGCRVGYYHEC